MMFSNPIWLWGLLALPLLALLEWRATRRARRALGLLVGPRRDSVLVSQRMPGDRRVGTLLWLSALGLLALGAAGPEWGREVVRRGATGSDLVLVIDVSASMDARDVPPSRVAEARREALAVIDRMAGSRVAVVAFSGDAVRVCPLTLDRSAAKLAVEGLSTGSVSEPGTDLGRALHNAMRLLPTGGREEQAMVLWTDGEATEPGAREVFDELQHAGVRVFAVGVGTRRGDVVPVLDADGRVIDIKRDETGNVVHSRLDEDYLHDLAKKTRGIFFRADRPGGELPHLTNALSSLAKAGRGERIIERPVARFPWFAAAAALLLIVDRARARRRRLPPSAALPLRRTASVAVTVLILAWPTSGSAQSDWARGDRAFDDGRFAEAESLYAQRLKKRATSAVRVNHATARALRGQLSEAESDLKRLSTVEGEVGLTSGYNLGTLLGERGRYDPALDALRKVLERDPGDTDARWNYEVLLRRRQQAEEERHQNPPQPDPRPQTPGGGVGQQQPQPVPAPPTPSPNPPPSPQPTAPQDATGLSRAQAEQLLDALEELSRAEQQRQRKVRVTRGRRGKDW